MNVRRKPPMEGLTYQNAETLTADYNGDEERFFVADLADAHIITSRVAGQVIHDDRTNPLGTSLEQTMHKLVLDIDMPAVLVPSSTPGHFHLYIDNLMTWENAERLLDALVACNVIEPGYVKAAKRRGFTAVRLPWVKKPAEPARRVDGSQVLPENQEDF